MTAQPQPSLARTGPVTVILRGGQANDAALDKAAALIRELTGQDAAAWTSQDGTRTIV